MVSNGAKQGRFYGWTALSGAMLVFFCGCGNLFYSFGVFVPPMTEEFGWSRSALAMGYTLFLLIMGLLGPLVGTTVSKFGARKNVIIGNLVAALGLAGMSLTQDIWHVYLFFGVLIGIGNAFGTFIPTISIANNWFIRRKVLAISLVLASGGVGGFAFPPLIAWLIANLGWQLAWVCLAGIHLVLATGIAGIIIRNKPEDLGQVPDGKITEVDQEAGPGRVASGRVYQTPVDWGTKAALRTHALWLIMFFDAATWFSLNILTVHQVAYLEGLGFSPMLAATTLGLVVGMSIFGRLGFGVLGTRFEIRHLAAICLAGFGISMVILINIKALPFSIIYLYTILVGVSYGGLAICLPTLLGAYYGRAHYAQILGWSSPIGMLVGAAGPLLAGFIYDQTGNYMPAFMAAAVLLGLGLVAALLARPPRPGTTRLQKD